MTKKSNSWNLQELQETLVKDTEQSIEQGFESIRNGESLVNTAQPPAEQREQKETEPTKGVQTYITMEDYSRLMAIKLKRDAAAKQKQQPRITIANLAEEAIGLWLDVQEGKAKVNKVI